MQTLVAEILAAWRRADRLTGEYAPGTLKHAAVMAACDQRARLTATSLPRARQARSPRPKPKSCCAHSTIAKTSPNPVHDDGMVLGAARTRGAIADALFRRCPICATMPPCIRSAGWAAARVLSGFRACSTCAPLSGGTQPRRA